MNKSGAVTANTPKWEDARAKQKPHWEKLTQFLSRRIKQSSGLGYPKYKILQDGLLDAIRTGVIGDNELLPTETELAIISPFSLGTVQRALKNLVAAGMIVRKAGVGTIVAPWRRELENPIHTKFIDLDGNILPLYTEVLSRRRVKEQGVWTDFLKPGPNLLNIKRRLIVERSKSEGGDFCYFSTFYVDGDKYPVFKETPKRELNGLNFKRTLSKEFNLVITRISNHLSIVEATTEIAVSLGVDVDTPLIRKRIHVHSMNGPLYYQEIFFPSGSQEFVIDTALDNRAEL